MVVKKRMLRINAALSVFFFERRIIAEQRRGAATTAVQIKQSLL
jgi:hypothetical protein